eukprot:3781856-Pleurochrysis_carterae.AAC.2
MPQHKRDCKDKHGSSHQQPLIAAPRRPHSRMCVSVGYHLNAHPSSTSPALLQPKARQRHHPPPRLATGLFSWPRSGSTQVSTYSVCPHSPNHVRHFSDEGRNLDSPPKESAVSYHDRLNWVAYKACVRLYACFAKTYKAEAI